MTDSVLSQRSELKSNRLDPPHDLMLATNEQDSSTPWMALAGRDPSSSPDQLDRQTSELLAYVQQQNDEIDARQAELNAKLAQLDNELRTARLRSGLDAGDELIAPASNATQYRIDSGLALDEIPEPATEPPADEPSVNPMPEPVTSPPPTPERNTGLTNGPTTDFREFEEVERLVAQFSNLASEEGSAKKTVAAPAPPAAVEPTTMETAKPVVAVVEDNPAARIVERMESEKSKIRKQTRVRKDAAHFDGVAAKVDSPAPATSKPKLPTSYSQMLEANSLTRADAVDMESMATSLDASELESERRLLAERKIELDRRKAMLQKMHDDTQSLHREALEMRLVTEQLWIEISGKAPEDHVNELMTGLRSKLDAHYNEQQSTIEGQESELLQLKKVIEQKQDDLRDQSDQLQQWVETRHDEIKTYAAEVDAREMLLDRRENRMREEFSKWEATRSTYQNQLQGLLAKLGGSAIG